MVTITVNDKKILSEYKNIEIEQKISNFIQKEFWIEEELILFWMDLDSQNKDLKNSYLKTKSLKNSEFIDF